MTDIWKILIIDDEPVMRQSMKGWLGEDGYAVDVAESGERGLQMAEDTDYAVCFIDLKMPGGIDGLETMRRLAISRPETAAVIITAYATVSTAISAMKEGAQDYIVKPCNPHEISALVTRILRVRKLERSNQLLRQKLLRSYTFHDIISKSPRMAQIFELIRDVAGTRSTVLIQGESGTGKEMIARAIHQESNRSRQDFVAVPCSALPESLLESELFGYEKGAFTGADTQRKGKVEQANKGTLFLDEIGDISSKMQKDLLRFLQERTFFRVGGNREQQVDVRVIAATRADLQRGVLDGSFRDDLFYRLNVINIRLPPLRERIEDIPLLARHFVEHISVEVGREVEGLTDEALRVLMSRDWPGNVRELENAIERALVTARGSVLDDRDFAFLLDGGDTGPEWAPPAGMTLSDIEQRAVETTLRRTQGNVKLSARLLGIDRSTLYEKIKRMGLQRPFVDTDE